MCLSVYPSVTANIVSKRLKLKTSLNFFDHPVVPSLSLFGPLRRYRIPKEPLQWGALSTRGWKEIGDFRRKSPFIPETERDRPTTTMER